MREGRHQAALFYADNGMVASSDPAWIQGVFNALVGLFGRVGLRTNVGKIVSMVCHPFQATAGNITQATYGRILTGGGELIQRAAAQAGVVRGMWGTAGGWFNVESSDDLTWESGRAKTPMDTLDRGWGPGIPDVLSN